jgi:hypothetical protein
MKIRLAAAALLILFAGPAVAQSDDGQSPSSDSPVGRVGELTDSLESGVPIFDQATQPELVDLGRLDEAGEASLKAALKAYYDQQKQGFDHRSRVFEWQLLSSKLIFGLVVLIVAVGLFFSWLQFMAGLREDADPQKMSTTLEASPTAGIKVSSPVLGVIILTLSLVFFYLYLVHVYPIEEI